MKLSEWRRQFGEKYRRYIDELSQLAVDTAQSIFDSAPAEYGNGGVAVGREFDGGVDFTIRASGADAAFIEFGTGVGVAVNPAFNVQASFPIEDGSWSRENDGPYSKNGYWYHNGMRLDGTPALGGMQEACIQMQNQSPDIARRVFG